LTDLRDIRLAQEEQLNTRAPKTKVFPAMIVKVEDSIHPPNRPDYVWVLEQGRKSNVLMVLNLKVAAVERLEVWVIESPLPGGELEIWGLFTDHIDLNNSGGGSLALPLHAQNHIFRDEANPPVDPVMVYEPAIGLLKTITNLSMIVNVLEHRYIYENHLYIFAGETVDLSAYVPSTANRNVVLLIGLDVISNLITVTSGNETLAIMSLDYPDIPEKTIPSSFVVLTSGQTYINSQEGHVIDCRDFLGLTPATLIPPPENEGDILISHNGTEWVRGLPVIDSLGEIVTSNGKIVTT